MIKKVTDTVTNCQLGFRRDMVHQLHLYSVTSIIDEKQRTEFTTFAFPDCKDTNDEIDHTKYQRDALNIIYSSNILLYMFRVSSTHPQEEQLYVSSIWYRHSL